MWRIWLEVAILAALAAFMIHVTRPSKQNLEDRGQHFAQVYLLSIAPSSVDAVDRANRTDFRDRLWAFMLGIGAYAVARVLGADYSFSGVAFGITGVALAIRWLRQAGRDFSPPPGAAVVARTRAVRISDYLPPLSMIASAACPALALFAVGIGADAVRRGVDDQEKAWFVITGGLSIAAVALLVSYLATALANRPQPASDAGHLYLQDAWRVEHLRDMLVLGCLGVMMLLIQADDLLPPTASVFLSTAPIAFTPLVIIAFRDSGRLHFRQRLWPELASCEWVSVRGPVPEGDAS